MIRHPMASARNTLRRHRPYQPALKRRSKIDAISMYPGKPRWPQLFRALSRRRKWASVPLTPAIASSRCVSKSILSWLQRYFSSPSSGQ